MVNELISLLVERHAFFTDLVIEHVLICGVAIGIILLLGMTIGILMTRSHTIKSIFLPLTSFLYTIPSIALFGILVTFTGIGNRSAVIALVIYGMLPMIRNVYVGITEVDKGILEAAKGMGASENELLLKVQLPLAMPVIFAGFRTMVVMTIALGAIASFIGAGGLGVAIYRGITTNHQAMIILGSLVVALLAIVTDGILGHIEGRMIKKYSVNRS